MFKSFLDCRQVSDDEWELLSDLVYDAGRFGVFTAKKGFVCDFCTIPRIPFLFWLMGGMAEGAGLIHDWLYRTGEVDRKTADIIFYMAMRDLGVPAWKAGLAYKGVRVFAGRIWEAYRRKDK